MIQWNVWVWLYSSDNRTEQVKDTEMPNLQSQDEEFDPVETAPVQNVNDG